MQDMITSADFTYALKAKKLEFSAPLLPRKSNYNSDTVCDGGQECRMGKTSVKNPERGKLLLWTRRPPPKGCRPHDQALNLPDTNSSPDVHSVHPREQTQSRTAQRGCRESAEHPLAERTPWEGRGSP